MRFVFILMICLLSVVGDAHATNAQEKLFFQYIKNNQFYTNQLEIKSKRIFRLGYPDCTAMASYVRLNPKILTPYQFTVKARTDEDTSPIHFNALNPSSGQWVERARIMACGESAIINTLVVAYDTDQPPLIYPLLNGQTHIDIKFQSRAENVAFREIQSKTGCSDRGLILNTSLIGYLSAEGNSLSATDNNAGWFEKWTVEACTETYDVNMAILPDPRNQFRYIANLQL